MVKLLEFREIIGAQGFDMVFQMIEIDPTQRITAAQALQHPFLNAETTCCQNPMTLVPNTYGNEMPYCHLLEHLKLLRQNELRYYSDNTYMKSI